MRLCNALIQYSLLISLSLFVYNCYGHEHTNHVDPVATKYSGSAGTVDPLAKPIETANVPKTDFQQHTEDEHQHDTIEARLQAKHNLRQSVHQHTDDDKHENEEDYINRLNSALEKGEHQFQYEAPPIADNVSHTSSGNQIKEGEQVPLHSEKETVSSNSTSEQQQQQIKEEVEAPKTVDISQKIPVPEEIVSPEQVQFNEQQLKNPVEQNNLHIHKETTVSATQSHQQEATNPIQSSSNSEEPKANTTINQTSETSGTLDIQQTSSKPLEVEKQQQPSETVHIPRSLDSDLEQAKPLVTLQNASSSDLNLEQATADTVQNNSSLEQHSTSIESDQKQQEIPSEIKPDINSIDANQPTSIIDTPKPTENVSSDIQTDEHSSVPKESTIHSQRQTPPPPTTTRILRSATSRLQQKVNARHHHHHPHDHHDHHDHHDAHTKPEEPKPSPVTETITPPSPTIEKPIEEQDRLPEFPSTLQPEELRVETFQTPTIDLSIPTEAPQTPTIDLNVPAETPQTPTIDLNVPTETPQAPTIDLNVPTEIPPTQTIDLNVPNETPLPQTIDASVINETDTPTNDPIIEPNDVIDLPRQVHVHDPQVIDELKEEINKNENPSLNEQIEDTATTASFLVNDHSPHLPRILENEETVSTLDSTVPTITNTLQTIETAAEAYSNPTQNDSKGEETNNTLTSKSNMTDGLSSIQYRQLCWRLPKPFEPSFGLVENELLRFINLLPEFLQTTLFGRIDDRETLMNTIWFSSICMTCFLFSLIFLSLGAKRLKQTKREKEIRARCQQLQQHNNQIELERATFERQNQKLSDEIDELKNLPVRDADEEIFEIREKYEQLHADWKIARSEHDALQREIDHKNSFMQKQEFELQKQVETVAYLNNEILRQKQELEKEREKVARVQSNDLSLERFEKLQEIINELKSEITQLKQDKFSQVDQLQQVQDHANQLDIDKNELTNKMKQLKELLEQRDETIARIREKMLDDNDDEEKATEIGDILSTAEENDTDDGQRLLSTIDNDVEKANQHMRDLHTEIEDKARRVKELDTLLNQEKDRCRELETKLKVVLELRERDAHLHIRQLGQTDAELRKARTDTERVRILQQQLELKQQQLDDVQKVLATEQTKFSEECSKLQHETHEKWMEVKRLTRELDGARKECEGLRRQITKYANNDRSSQEKTMHKPVPQHLNNTGRLSSEPETNGSSPPTLPYQQGDNFRPIDHERNDSGAASPSDMYRMRPPVFGLARPPFFPPPFMPPPPPNPFMMVPRYPMPVGGPHGMISPIPHLMTNGSGGGSDTNSFEIVDSTNITPNSTSYDAQLNGSAVSPTPDDEQQATTKTKKPKKSLKKKTKTSTTTTVSATKEDV